MRILAALTLGATLLAGALPAWASDLALKRVMLSSAGVGYFEYEAAVEGAGALGLDVPLEQVDDVLNSLVVFDSAGGVGTLELPGRDDTHAAFGNVPFGPAALDSPIAFLNSLQGIEISVQGPRPMTGRIMHADVVTETIPGVPGRLPTTVRHTRVTLLGPDGLRQFVLEEADGVQVADPTLRERIGRALEAVRRQTSQSIRHITLRSSGTAPRTVRVAYVAVAPLWKATYRLVLPSEPGEKARLQAWAVLENQSGAAWDGVALTLQYGNPVTFRQAIYRSYYVERPEVPVEVLGRILPNVDTRGRPMPEPYAKTERALRAPAPAGMPMQAGPAAAAAAPPPLAEPTKAAEASENAEETIFQVPAPVTLAAGYSASVPIIDRRISAERLDLVPADSTKALSALRILNDTGTSLPAGVLTLYDAAGAAVFAGDARLGGLPAGETRLLSFAQDLRTTAERDESSGRMLAALTAADGVLHVTYRERDVLRVTITAPAEASRRVLVEFAKQPDTTFTLEGPSVAGVEETASAWRVPVALQPGEVRKLTGYRDRTSREDVALLARDGNDIAPALATILNEQTLDARARAALEQVMGLRQDEARRQADLARVKAQLDAVTQDEDRVRKNLDAVAANDALHARLTRALDADETRIAQLQQAIEQAEAAVQHAHQVLADAIRALRL
jgi:hypothetical protein